VNLNEFLHRFRLHGVPGAARPAGVPADLPSERAAELAPVFAALEPVLRRTEDLRAAAARDASVLTQQAAAAGRERVERARRRAGDEAAAEAASALAGLDSELRRQLAEAGRDAERLEVRASDRIPALATRIAGVALGLPRSQARA
jgi:hypothetical protein